MIDVLATALEAMVAHARADAPQESCGLLIGHANRIERVQRARNLRASPTEYLVDPTDHFAAIRAARADGLAVVGAYHSHPDSTAVPSPKDVAEASYPEFVYVIVSPRGDTRPEPEIRGYRLVNGILQEVNLVPVPSSRLQGSGERQGLWRPRRPPRPASSG